MIRPEEKEKVDWLVEFLPEDVKEGKKLVIILVNYQI